MASGTSSGSITTVAYFVTGSAIPTMSVSWKASLPSSARGTLPVIATIGTRVHHRRRQAGDEVDRPRPGRRDRDADAPRCAAEPVGGVRPALLMANEDVAKRELAEDVIDRKDRAAGIAEDRRHALADQALADGARTDAWRDRRGGVGA